MNTDQRMPYVSQQDPLYGLTGSRMQPQKTSTPRGVYVIGCFNLLAFIASFFDTSQTSLIYTVVMLLGLLAAIGLMLRVEAARKTMITLASITLAMSVISVLLLVNLQHKIATSRASYNTAISRIHVSDLTASEQSQLNELKTTMTTAQEKAGKAIDYTYTLLALYVVESVVVIRYLSRPRIKDVFST